MKESAIEKQVCDYAKAQGWLVRKYDSRWHSGQPDRIFMGFGRVFWIEFKAPGGQLSKIQQHEIALMRAAGMTVHVCDNVDQGRMLVDIERRKAGDAA